MPRMWQPKHGVSPFADLLVQRMTEQVPPLQPHHIAKYLGIEQTVVSHWLIRGSVPSATVCALLAVFFHDDPETWYRAAGRHALEVSSSRLTSDEIQRFANRSGIPAHEFYKVLSPSQELASPPPAYIRTQREVIADRVIDDPRIPLDAKEDILALLANAQPDHDQYARHKAAEHDPAATPGSWEGFFTSWQTWDYLLSMAQRLGWPEATTRAYIQLTRQVQAAMEDYYLHRGLSTQQQQEEEVRPAQQDDPATTPRRK